MHEVLNDHIYLYYISKGNVLYERTFPRSPAGVRAAKFRVDELQDRGQEAFYVVGAIFPGAFY